MQSGHLKHSAGGARCAESTARPQRHELQERVASHPNNPLSATISTRTSLGFDGGSAGSSCSLSKRLSEPTQVGVEASVFRSTKRRKANGHVAVTPVDVVDSADVMHR